MCINPKYNIRPRLHKLPGNIRSNFYQVCIDLDIAERTLNNWMETTKTEKFSIPSDALIYFATKFNCTERELINSNG
jgi:hypothetical protein